MGVHTPHGTSATVELMLSCLRVDAAQVATLPDAAAEHIREFLAGGVDGRLLLEAAQWQRVTPLIWTVLNAVAPAALAPGAAAEFEAAVRSNSLRNLYLTRRLLRLARVFAEHDIELLAYKGPVLAAQVYGPLSLRQFSDLDVLVRPEQIGQARALIQAEGYRQVWPTAGLTPGQERRHLRAKYNLAFCHPEDQTTLELHWSLTPNYLGLPRDVSELWNGLGEITLAGQSLRAFAPDRLLLVLCIHGANHCWLRLNWVCDVSQLVRRYPNLDWDAVTRMARRWGCLRILHLGLQLANGLLGLELPADVRQALAQDAEAGRLATQAARRLTRYPTYWLRPFEEPLFHIRMRERLADRARYCLAMATPTVTDWNYLPLPEALAPLYYFIRPVRLFMDHGLKLCREGDQ